ncbi:MAG: hypothetical protein WB756_01605, partial [Xanthobacteraceae bacterium]
GAPGELIIAPPYQRDGHNLIFGQPIWRDAVYDFLKRNHLPFAAPTLAPPPQATAEFVQAFKDYLATPNYERRSLPAPLAITAGRRATRASMPHSPRPASNASSTVTSFTQSTTHWREPVRDRKRPRHWRVRPL